jgi:lysophospholipase L1-like esterase
MRSRATNVSPWLVGSALYVVAFLVLSWGGYDRRPVTVAIGLLLLIVAARQLRNGLVVAPRWARIGAPALMMVVGAGLVASWFLGTPTGGWGLAGLCAFFLGLGHAVSVWREGARWKLTRGLVVLVVLAIVAVAGVVLCLVVNALWLIAAVVALLLMPIGITLLSEDLLRDDPRWPWWTWVTGGALVVIAVVWLALRTDMTWALALAVAAAAIGLMLAIASNTQADVVLIVLVVAVAWLGVPHGVDPDPSVAPRDRQPVLVSLGDSYMSGEGAKTFLKGTNDPARPNECRRSRTAYAHLTVAEGGVREYDHLAFYACSGALAAHVHELPQHAGEPLDDTPESGLDQLQQLVDLREHHDVDLQLVIVSIGGNDAGFSSIGTDCVAPGSCVALGQRWLDTLPGVAAKVKGAFTEIRRTLDAIQAGVPVLVVPYPVPIRERGCSYSSLGDDEHRFVNAFVGQLNGAIRTVARESEFYVLEDMERAFGTTLRICDGPLSEIGENFIAPSSVEGVLDQALNPRNWIHNSFHPNERGHEAMSRVLAAWITAHPEPAGVPGPDDQASTFTPASLEEIMGTDVAYCGGEGEPAFCDRKATPWAITQLGVLAGQIALPALLLAVGAWLLAMGALVRYRGRKR